MSYLPYDILSNISNSSTVEDLNQIFQDLIIEVKSYLKINIAYTHVEIQKVEDFESLSIFDLGIKRNLENNNAVLTISEKYERFYPFILMREAYYAFIPLSLKETRIIQIFINQILEINLHKFQEIKEWKNLIRKTAVDDFFLLGNYDRLDKFLELKGTDLTIDIVKFFFSYIRRNPTVMNENNNNFYEIIFKEYTFMISKSIYKDEIIETISNLIDIFYDVKSYRAFLDYGNFFMDFKEKGKISTVLSLRKFRSNIQWINRCTSLAPSYQINWRVIDCDVVMCLLRFNPILNKSDIDKVIEKLPFFLSSRSTDANFAIEYIGWFVIPQSYIEDLKNLLMNLKDNGYLIKNYCVRYDKFVNFLNLNYLREFHKRKNIININHRLYDKKYEKSFELIYLKKKKIDFSFLDFLLVDRIRWFSATGFAFERRSETVNKLKSDIFVEILKQQGGLKDLRKNLNYLHNNYDIREDFLKFLENNRTSSSFYINDLLENVLKSMDIIEKILKEKNVYNYLKLKELIKNRQFFQNVENRITFNKIRKFISKELITLYFNDKKKYRGEIKKFQIYLNYIKSCLNIKIFNISNIKRLIQDKTIIEKVINTKETKLKAIYKKYQKKKFTSNDIDDLLDEYVSPDINLIQPSLISTISTTNFASYYLVIILKDLEDTNRKIDKIRSFFPRVISYIGKDLLTNEDLVVLELYLPMISVKEREILISSIYNIFEDLILSSKRYFFDGFISSFSRKDFYDFENYNFFYTKSLFEQYSIYVRNIFIKDFKYPDEKVTEISQNFWIIDSNLLKLEERVKDRTAREQIVFNINLFRELTKFNNKLTTFLLNIEEFRIRKKEEFFTTFVRSIKFIPNFQAFGIGQYFLYVKTSDLEEIDFKLLLNNSFQNIKYPAYIDNVQSLFIKYIFPFRNPNKAYLNWMTKSKKNFSEYCFFRIKKTYQILHFDYNIMQNGWNLDPNRFKVFIQNILFNPKYIKDKGMEDIKVFNIGDNTTSSYYSPNSTEFTSLSGIFNRKSLDIKSVLGTKRIPIIEKITELLNKKLIFPYLKLKNLGFYERLFIIIPKIRKQDVELLTRVFQYFNNCLIHEIEGEFYIYGYEEEINFEDGLFIKLYLPSIEFSRFQQILQDLFQFLEIKHYLILSDMVRGNNLLESIYGNLDFLQTYNPLKNLNWSKKDQRYINNKLFGENFEPNYPDLIPNEKEKEK